ncbi:MAG: biotin--[acetyl-CoA-carboxylase] ligase [Phycisphaeraceae bacterium]
MSDSLGIKLLPLLLEPASDWSVQELSERAGLIDADVLSGFDQLRRDGCGIDIHGPERVRLVSSGLSCWGDYLEASIEHQLRVEVYHQTSSTQDVLKRLLDGEQRGATVAMADEQTAGRGRRGRSWLAASGDGLLMSLAWPLEGSEPVERMPVIGCLAVAESVHLLPTHQAATIRWPNDVLLNDRKLAGVLIERVADASGQSWAVIGWGINVLGTPEVEGPQRLDGSITAPTSLADLGLRIDRLWLAHAVLERFVSLTKLDTSDLAERWRVRSSDLGRQATLKVNGQMLCGEVIDVDITSGLVLRDHSGVCHWVPSAQASRACDEVA